MRPLRKLSAAGAALSFFAWFLLFSYADWLRFISPVAPTPATGQVIREKTARAVFYITPEQAFWVQDLILPIWLLGAVSLGFLYLTRAEKPAKPAPLNPLRTMIACIGIAGLFAILFFGDRLLGPLFRLFPASTI